MTAVVLNVDRASVLTANQRLHWRQKAQRTRVIRNVTYVVARPALEPFPARMRCVVNVAYPDARRRDVHNLMPTVKAAIDGLVDAGWLTDDSDKYLQGPDLRPTDERCAKGLACQLTITFQECNNA